MHDFSSFEIKREGLNKKGYLESEIIREILFRLLCCDCLHVFDSDGFLLRRYHSAASNRLGRSRYVFRMSCLFFFFFDLILQSSPVIVFSPTVFFILTQFFCFLTLLVRLICAILGKSM